jgi:hypothetical protein
MPSELEAIKRLLLREWDPIGLSDCDGAESHYDAYALRVFEMLNEGADAISIASYLTRVVTTELMITANPNWDRVIAAKVFAIMRPGEL